MTPASSTAGPSRPTPPAGSPAGRPAPARTLRQPLALNVAERTGGSIAPPPRSDAATLRTALERRAQIAKRAEKWMDKAMEEVLSVGDFQRALSYMHAAQYAEVQHERHLNSLCAYPLCANGPAAPYAAHKRFVVSTAKRTITEKEGNDEQGFCGRKCAARSAWVASRLGTEAAWIRGKVDPIELLEDKEARGEVTWGGRRGDVLVWVTKEKEERGAGVPPPSTVTNGRSAGNRTPRSADASPAPSSTTTPTKSTAPPEAAAATPPPAPSPASDVPRSLPADQAIPPTAKPQPLDAGGMSDLIASLSIVERATPARKPLPPSATSGTYVEQGAVIGGAGSVLPLPHPVGGVLASSSSAASSVTASGKVSASASPSRSPAPTPAAAAAKRRAAGSSMLGSSGSKIATAVLNATKTIALPDSSDEESADEEDWAKEMGWGGGAEVDALFEEARRAREMMG